MCVCLFSWICLRTLEKNKTYSPKGALIRPKIKIKKHLKQTQGILLGSVLLVFFFVSLVSVGCL